MHRTIPALWHDRCRRCRQWQAVRGRRSDHQRPKALLLDPTTTFGREPIVAVPASRDSNLGSVIEIVRSKQLLEEVVATVGIPALLGQGEPANTPNAEVQPPAKRPANFDLAVQALARGLTVELVKKTSIVQITYDGFSPQTAQEVVAAIVERATERHIHLNRNPRAYTFVVEQTTRLKTELDNQERKLSDLKRATGLYSPEAERQAAVSRLARVRDDLLQTKATLAAVAKEIQFTRDQLAQLPTNQTTARTTGHLGTSNDALRNQMVVLQTREQEVRTRYSANHPEARLLRQQLDGVREQLAQEEKQNPREQVVIAPSRLHEDLYLGLLRAQAQVTGLQARLEQLSEQQMDEQTALGELDTNAVSLNRQQREVELLAASYRKCAENLEPTQLDRALEAEKISNISVVQLATFDPTPVRPRLATNLGIGFGLALVGALALGWLLESLRPAPSASSQKS